MTLRRTSRGSRTFRRSSAERKASDITPGVSFGHAGRSQRAHGRQPGGIGRHLPRVGSTRRDASACAVSFNGWTDQPLTRSGPFWSAFIPGVKEGDEYKFFVEGLGSTGYKRDPFARELTRDPAFPNSNCIVARPRAYPWHDAGFRPPPFNEIVLYQLHVGAFYSTDAQGKRRAAPAAGRVSSTCCSASIPGVARHQRRADPADPGIRDDALAGLQRHSTTSRPRWTTRVDPDDRGVSRATWTRRTSCSRAAGLAPLRGRGSRGPGAAAHGD